MFNTPNPGNYKPPKTALAVNTPSSIKKPTKQSNYGMTPNHVERMRDSSPSGPNNVPRNLYNYQNMLQKVASTAKKQSTNYDSKQLYANHDSRSANNSKIIHSNTHSTAKSNERGDYGSQLKANAQEKVEKVGYRDLKSSNHLQETVRNEQNSTASKPARPLSANHTAYKGYQVENRNEVSPLGENYAPRPNKIRNEMEKVISLIGKERKSRDSSPSSMLRKNSKGFGSDFRSKESIDNNKRSVNKRMGLDFEEDLNSKTIENIMMPMTTTYSFSLNKLNNSMKGGTRTGRNTPLDKSRQNSIIQQKKGNSRETLDMDYKNLALPKEETANFSTGTAKESPIQLPGKLITASNSRIAHSEVNTQRYNFQDNYNLFTQPMTLNDCTMPGQDTQQSNPRPSSQHLNSRNLNIQTAKENKTIDIAAFLKNFNEKRNEEKTDLSADSISSQIPNENVQIQELPITNILDKQSQTKRASEGIPNILSTRRDEGTLGGSFPASMKNYFKGQRTRSENPHKTGHKNIKIDTSQDNLELEQTIKKMLNTSDNLSRRGYKRGVSSKPEIADERLEVTKGYNFNREEYDRGFKENRLEQVKVELFAQTPKNIRRATPNETKLDIAVKPNSPKNVSILSVSEEEREAKKAIFKQDYSIGKEVGRGAYAAVRSGTHKPSNMKVAIKIYQKEKISDPMRRKSVRREIKVMQRMNHPNVIKIYDTFETRNYVNIIMEYVDGPSLYTFLKSQPDRRLKEKHAFRLFKQLVEGLDYCHTRCITHRDIKLENILLDRSGTVKIIDYGFTTCIPNDKKVKLFCGTPSYMAPEIVQKKEYCGPPVDIWALGVLLYVLLCGSFPFRGDTDKELYKAISKGEFAIPSYVSDEAAKLIKRILNIDADQRPTAKEITNDPWFVIHSFLEKKKANKHRRCASAEKTKGKPSQIITNMVPEFLEIKNNHEGFINLNQFTTGVRPAFCLTRDRDDRPKEKNSDEIARRKRCHTPSSNHTTNKVKHFVFEGSDGNKLNFRRFEKGLGTRETDNGELFGLEDTYDENKFMKKTMNEIEVWNNGTNNLSDKSGKKEFGKSSLLNKTIAILNKSERRDDTHFRYDPEAIKNIINMGYTEEEIIRRLKDKCGIIFAIYTWMTKDNKLSESSNSSVSGSSDSSGLAKACYGMLSASNNTTKRKALNQNARHSPLDDMSVENKNLCDLTSPNLHKLNANLKKDVEDLSNKWMEKFG